MDEGDYEKGDTAYQIVEARELVREDDEERVKELLVIYSSVFFYFFLNRFNGNLEKISISRSQAGLHTIA